MSVGAALLLALLTAQPSALPRGRHASRDAVQACMQATVASGPDLKTREQVDTLVTRCSVVYLETPCRDAWREATARKPVERSRPVLQACAAAYCTKLAAPVPQLCGLDLAALDFESRRP